MANNFSNKSATMNDLPNELLTFIFEHLKIKDIIRCSLVCKRFKLLCQDVRIPELIISNTTDNIKDYWFYTKKQFNQQDSIDATTFNVYRSIFRLDKFRRLYFEECPSKYVQLRANDFTQLEQMIINVKGVVGVKYEIHIDLPNLKIMEIDSYDPSCCTFVITSPKLEMLSCYDFNDIHLTYRNTITHLETKLYTEKFHALKNLQFLHVCDEFPLEIIRPKILSIFPKLKTFACSPLVGRRSFKNLIKEKNRLQRPGLRIYFHSVELDDVKKIREYEHYVDEFLFQINNYNKLAEIADCEAVNYNALMDLMGNKIPDDFYKKYFNARTITVATIVENPEHLLGFIKNFDYLTILYLWSASLDQTFYNSLVVLDQLTYLEITNSKSIFNFDFILKLKLLRNFQTTRCSPKHFDLVLASFNHLKYFQSTRFPSEGRSILIRKNEATNYYEIISSGYKKNELDFNGLTHEVDALKRRLINQD